MGSVRSTSAAKKGQHGLGHQGGVDGRDGVETGLLASLPVISGAVAMVEHARGGHRAAANFLHGYAWGLFGKAAFGAAFVLLAPHVGAATALALACACAGLMSLMRPGHVQVPLRLALARRGRG